MWRFNLLLLRLLGEISLSLLCSHTPRGSVLDLALPLCVGLLRASVLRSDRTGLKEQLIRWLWLTQAGARKGYGVRGEPTVAEPGVTFHQPEASTCSPWGVFPGSRDSGSGGLHRLPGG